MYACMLIGFLYWYFCVKHGFTASHKVYINKASAVTAVQINMQIMQST